MLKTVLAGAAVGVALSFSAVAAQAAGEFVCPAITGADAQAQAKTVQELLGQGDPLDRPEQLDAAVDALKKAGVSRAMIIDQVVAAYCPSVAANKSLSTLQKTLRVQQVAAILTHRVYNITDEEAVFVNVPLPPTTADRVNALAKEAGVSPGEWIAGLVVQSTPAR